LFFGRFLLFFCRCLMPNLRSLIAFRLTHAFWLECPSPSPPAAGHTGHAGCRSSERGLHAPEGFLPFGARDGHVSPFSGLARWGGGFRRCLFGWVVPGPARVSHAPPVLAKSAFLLLALGCSLCLWLCFQSTYVIFGHFGIVLMAFC
jgi:hypothetical protein